VQDKMNQNKNHSLSQPDKDWWGKCGSMGVWECGSGIIVNFAVESVRLKSSVILH
jgi:hypothetical protein